MQNAHGLEVYIALSRALRSVKIDSSIRRPNLVRLLGLYVVIEPLFCSLVHMNHIITYFQYIPENIPSSIHSLLQLPYLSFLPWG